MAETISRQEPAGCGKTGKRNFGLDSLESVSFWMNTCCRCGNGTRLCVCMCLLWHSSMSPWIGFLDFEKLPRLFLCNVSIIVHLRTNPDFASEFALWF